MRHPSGLRRHGYLTQEARRKLDAAGWTECQISASNSLDEYIIQDLLLQGAKIDVFGVGERMITARSEPVFGGVYKLAAVEDGDGKIIPKIKVSENLDKITIPHFKKTYRIFDNATGKAEADYITVWDETVDESAPLELFDPRATWKRKTYTNLPQSPFRSRSFREESWSISCPPCRRSRPTAVPRWIPVGHGEAVREPSHLLCGSESEAVRHQAGSALPEQMTQQPRPPAGLFVHRILVAECWVFRYNNKISGRS
mgnify:CR=1 FL=1